MGLGPKWSTTVLLGAAAGLGAAVAGARRAARIGGPARGYRPPPAASLGVDGLGEVPADDADALPYPPASSEAPAVAPGGDDAAAALDEARARLRQRADDLARRMEQGDA